MNLLYKVHSKDNRDQYSFKEEISLLGCNHGKIPWAIREFIIGEIKLDDGWKLDIASIFNTWNEKVVIDLKPNHSTEIFLVELTDVYGFNHATEWTALLYRFRLLYNAEKSSSFSRENFSIDHQLEPEIIYSFLYALGNVRDGELQGKWSPPFGSMTGLLMWENSYRYFREVMDCDPQYNLPG